MAKGDNRRQCRERWQCEITGDIGGDFVVGEVVEETITEGARNIQEGDGNRRFCRGKLFRETAMGDNSSCKGRFADKGSHKTQHEMLQGEKFQMEMSLGETLQGEAANGDCSITADGEELGGQAGGNHSGDWCGGHTQIFILCIFTLRTQHYYQQNVHSWISLKNAKKFHILSM